MKSSLEQFNWNAIARDFGLSVVTLFGSQARGTATGQSDVDIAVLPIAELGMDREIELEETIKKMIGHDNVQIANMATASPLLLQQIMNDGSVLYQAQPWGYEQLKSYAYKLFVETKWLRDLRHARLLQTI